MSDRTVSIIKTVVIAAAIVIAAVLLSDAINQAGLNISNGLNNIARTIQGQ